MAIDTKNTMEILFNPTDARRIKFVFTEGYENWAIVLSLEFINQIVSLK